MPDLRKKAQQFRSLHVAGRPLILFNAWDAGSARAVASGGAQAIATGSWSVAAANGYPDGEAVPFDLVLGNLARIAAAVELPVSVDLERGYGANADAVGKSVAQLIRAGAIGCNIEDSLAQAGQLRQVGEQAERIGSARAAATATLPDFFINARTDLFLGSDPATHAKLIDEAIARASAYALAGADGLFVPGLTDEGLIGQIVAACSLPVNIMVGDSTPAAARLAQLRVARISHGPRPFLRMMTMLEAAAREAIG